MGFNPTFTRVESVQECADLINVPHEDYPRRVDVTAEMINFYLGENLEYITEKVLKSIHAYIMYDMKTAWRGAWRKEMAFLQKSDGDIIALTAPIMIEGEIEEGQVFPLYFEDMLDDSDLIRWYRAFQIIHPFMDGNGRAGGAAVAIASHYITNGEYILAPCQ
jgi:fido (protein-threonine AMPylation protein)